MATYARSPIYKNWTFVSRNSNSNYSQVAVKYLAYMIPGDAI